MKYRILLATAFVSIAVGPVARADQVSAPARKPNIVLIYADDLGAGMLGCYGQRIVRTPNIDRLAAEGSRFSRVYGCTYCAPSRASLLTGMSDSRRGLWTIPAGGGVIAMDEGKTTQAAIDAAVEKSIRPGGAPFLAQVLQKAGYRTGQFGKLDWGFITNHAQIKSHGWDDYMGYMDHERAHGFYPVYLWHNGEKMPLPGNTDLHAGKTREVYGPAETLRRRDRTGKQTYSQNVLIDGALGFIRANKNRPFFLYHPTQLPHGPVDIPAVHPDFANDSRLTDVEKEYASMIRMLDDHVGLILAELKARGLADNTLVIFMSDNGHELYTVPGGVKAKARSRDYHGESDVFRGSLDWAALKWTNFEGGIRLPFIARWPGHIPAGVTCDRLIAGYDLMPTFAEAARLNPPAGKDGVSFLPSLLGRAQPARDAVFVGRSVITGDGWKLVALPGKAPLLFNLNADPGERHDLSAAEPERTRALQAKLASCSATDKPQAARARRPETKIENKNPS